MGAIRPPGWRKGGVPLRWVVNRASVCLWVAVAAPTIIGAGCSRDPGPAATPPSRSAVAETLDAGEILFRKGQLDDAEAVAAALVKRAPQEWAGHELLGRVRAAKALQVAAIGDDATASGLRLEAAASYGEASRLRPADAALHQARGLALLAAGRSDEAGQAFAEAGRLDPENAQYPLFEAQVHLTAGRIDRARAALLRVLEIRPEEALAHASLAECLRQEGELEAALTSVRTARRLDPSSLSCRVLEARLLRLAGRPREGLELLLAVGEARWSDPTAVEEVALGWMALGEGSRAAAAWEACHRHHPAHVQALRRAAEAWRSAGDPVRAKVLEDEASLRGG